MGNKNFNLYLNCTVLSEYTYYLLAIEGGKSPRAIKEDENIGTILTRNNPEPFLSAFQMVA